MILFKYEGETKNKDLVFSIPKDTRINIPSPRKKIVLLGMDCVKIKGGVYLSIEDFKLI